MPKLHRILHGNVTKMIIIALTERDLCTLDSRNYDPISIAEWTIEHLSSMGLSLPIIYAEFCMSKFFISIFF